MVMALILHKKRQFVPLPLIDLTGQTQQSAQIRFTYEAEIAVDFVYNLAKEPEFFREYPTYWELQSSARIGYYCNTDAFIMAENADVLS